MFWFICIWSNIISIDGFILQDTYNVLLNDVADYKVDLVINSDDYEMINKNELKQFKIANEQEKFNELEEMARKQVQETLRIKTKNMRMPYQAILPMIVVTSKYNNTLTTFIGPLLINTKRINKREATKGNVTDYDYDYFVDEYYVEADAESKSNKAYHISKSDVNDFEYGVIQSLKRIFSLPSNNTNCTEVKGIGLLALKCVIEDYISQRQSTSDALGRLWNIFRIWFFVYLVVAVPLWCTRGWCCCCLCCKFFKPRQTIEEAKKYLILYPPGVFKTKSGEIRYEPSEREKECYEEFEHFIKTL